MLVDDLVRRSDFIILTAVLVPETKFIINEDRLAHMKSNAVIINVGRGRKHNIIYLYDVITFNHIFIIIYFYVSLVKL